MIKSDQINELATAMAKAQSEIESAKKDSKAYGYSYSDLSTVIAAIKPALNKHGISFTQLIEDGDANSVKVTTLLLHSSGQYIGSTGSTEIPEMKGCNLAQRSGAAQSYLKRYQLQALTGLPTEDNDASSEGFSKSAPAYTKPTEVKVETKVATPNKTDAAVAKVEEKKTGFGVKKTVTKTEDGWE
jgi:hypothetical protein